MSDGTIVYCSREDSIQPRFALDLTILAQRHPGCKVTHILTNDIANGRNQAVLDAEGEWVWFVDTDMCFAPTTLERLLTHNVDVVQALVLKRHPPHEPLVWEDGPTMQNKYPRGRPRLIEVQSCGAGGTLYRRKIFETIPGPWFEGILGTEDTTFAAKIKAAGFKLHVDMQTPMGHLTPMVIWPTYINGSWKIRYTAANNQSVVMETLEKSPIQIPELVTK